MTYAQKISSFMDKQTEINEIPRNFVENLKKDKYPNGYLKICASWLKRLWGEEVEKNLIKGQTDVMDSCGATVGPNKITPNRKF